MYTTFLYLMKNDLILIKRIISCTTRPILQLTTGNFGFFQILLLKVMTNSLTRLIERGLIWNLENSPSFTTVNFGYSRLWKTILFLCYSYQNAYLITINSITKPSHSSTGKPTMFTDIAHKRATMLQRRLDTPWWLIETETLSPDSKIHQLMHMRSTRHEISCLKFLTLTDSWLRLASGKWSEESQFITIEYSN